MIVGGFVLGVTVLAPLFMAMWRPPPPDACGLYWMPPIMLADFAGGFAAFLLTSVVLRVLSRKHETEKVDEEPNTACPLSPLRRRHRWLCWRPWHWMMKQGSTTVASFGAVSGGRAVGRQVT